MDPAHQKEEEFKKILDVYSPFMNFQVQRFNLVKYGLDPEDILQDVKIRIWKLVRDGRTVLSPTSYIRRIVSSAVIDQLRKRRRDDSLYLHEKQKHISEQNYPYSGETIQKKAFEETVGRAIEQLMDTRRQVVKLYLLNLNIQEISIYMNWSIDKTRNLLYRGFADIRKILRAMETQNEK
ncbi:MAG TPA: RNA polymerase sigma factor [Candidatus Aminicenantes bacterium]|nr:RNA polymerase sigma factor [Candidatus Aminicenantes bacterium]HRY66119.1 RNA polymerase sigma factor [Candidatus Aminicenantes bacterium]HRZ73033.1 RNA polymerase sigma factor [Candidatus Aminicenantes bacterium]